MDLNTSIIVSLAYGFDTNKGNVDYIETLTAGSNRWTNLTASTTNYLAIQRNRSTGSVGYWKDTYSPVYSYYTPTARYTGDIYFNITEMKWYVWNGSSWAAASYEYMFLGEAITNASSVTSIKTYALNGMYDSGLNSFSFGSTYSHNHNIGTDLVTHKLIFECITTEAGYPVGDQIDHTSLALASGNYTIGSWHNSLSAGWSVDNALVLRSRTGGANPARTASKWNYKMIVERNF